MSTEQVMDDETQMAAALAELRSERTEPTETQEPAPVAEAPAPVIATAENDTTETPKVTETNTVQAEPADELRKTQAELQKARSEIGRVNALNRLYNETRQKAEQLERENASLKQSSKPVVPDELSDDAARQLAEVAEKVKDFPELSGLVAAVGAALKSVDTKAAQVATQAAAQAIQPLEGLRTEAEQRRQQEHQAAYQAAMDTFQSTYPTAVDVVKSHDFNSWINAAPKPVQDAFRHGSTPDEAIAVLDAYDAHLRRAGRPSIAQYPSQLQPTAAAPKTTSNTQRLQAAAGLPSRVSGAKGGMPAEDDFDGALAFFRSKRLKAVA